MAVHVLQTCRGEVLGLLVMSMSKHSLFFPSWIQQTTFMSARYSELSDWDHGGATQLGHFQTKRSFQPWFNYRENTRTETGKQARDYENNLHHVTVMSQAQQEQRTTGLQWKVSCRSTWTINIWIISLGMPPNGFHTKKKKKTLSCPPFSPLRSAGATCLSITPQHTYSLHASQFQRLDDPKNRHRKKKKTAFQTLKADTGDQYLTCTACCIKGDTRRCF